MKAGWETAAVQGMLTGLPVVHSPIPLLAVQFDRVHPCRSARGCRRRATALEQHVRDTSCFLRIQLPPMP
ncbi:MAG: hypothetical protein IK066_09260 [Kiritimatiellae bacterium]|nr:hypothetical protein [Kiritimatiellia bacterium]